MICDADNLEVQANCFRCIPKGSRRGVWIYLLCQIANQGAAAAQNWSNRVVANGGVAPSSNTVAALATFYTQLSLSGLLPKMISVCCFVPDNLTAAITPLIVGPGNAIWTQHNSVPGDLSPNGLATDGATNYFDTGVVPSTAFANDTSAGVSLYNTQAANENTTDFGSQNAGGTQQWQMVISAILPSSFWNCWNGTAGQGSINGANPLWTGFLSGSRTAADATNLYKASSTVTFTNIATGNTTGGTRPALAAYLAAMNNNGVAASFSVRTFSFAAIHLGLSAADTQNLFNCVQAMRVTLKGGYV